MKDPELIELRNKYLLGIMISIIVIIPFFLFFYNRLIPKDSSIVKKIKEENSMLILVTSNSCGKCITYKKELKENNVSYEILNIDKALDYEEILKMLEVVKTDIEIPSLIYVEKEKAVAILSNIKDEEEMLTFITNHTYGGIE